MQNTLSNPFILDDVAAVINNKDITNYNSFFDHLNHDFWGNPLQSAQSHTQFRPWIVISFKLNYLYVSKIKFMKIYFNFKNKTIGSI